MNTIKIGDNIKIGPRVSLYTAGHPIDSDVRATNPEYDAPIVIKDGVWLEETSLFYLELPLEKTQ